MRFTAPLQSLATLRCLHGLFLATVSPVLIASSSALNGSAIFRCCWNPSNHLPHPSLEMPAQPERFYLPFKMKCEECRSVLAKDVKVDAQRKKFGNSKIRSFTFKCCCCGSKIVVEKENSDYTVVEGARKKVTKRTMKPPGVLDLDDPIIREQLETFLFRTRHCE